MTRLTSERMGLPPPDVFILWSGDQKIGWTQSNRIGFTGFADEQVAEAAAWIANIALTRRWNRNGAHLSFSDVPRLGLVRHDSGEWMWAGDRAFVQVIGPDAPAPGGEAGADGAARDWWSIEIELPAYATDLAVTSAAHVIHAALRQSGLSWAALDEFHGRADERREVSSAHAVDASAMQRIRELRRRLSDAWKQSAIGRAFRSPRTIHFD